MRRTLRSYLAAFGEELAAAVACPERSALCGVFVWLCGVGCGGVRLLCVLRVNGGPWWQV